jgi:Mn-dependent DtxR family transcriptional regulator
MDDATHTVLTALTAAMNARGQATTSFELTGRLAAKGIHFSAMSRALHWLDANGYVRRTGDGEYAITDEGRAAASLMRAKS